MEVNVSAMCSGLFPVKHFKHLCPTVLNAALFQRRLIERNVLGRMVYNSQHLPLSFLFFFSHNRKHALNCHRMKPALFSVLCEIKERTGTLSVCFLVLTSARRAKRQTCARSVNPQVHILNPPYPAFSAQLN